MLRLKRLNRLIFHLKSAAPMEDKKAAWRQGKLDFVIMVESTD
jgi:hypothetical protein